MIIYGNQKFIQVNFENEEEIENLVYENYEYLFGPSSFLLPKKIIKTYDGFGTIPDGFAIDIENKNWYIVEAELAKHSVWGHIAQQVTKQIVAAQQITTKELLIEIAKNQYAENNNIKEKFIDENIPEINIRKVLDEILAKDPIVGIPIDKISEDLKQWARTLKFNVKLWTIKKYVDLENSNNILYEFPEEYRPDIDTKEEVTQQENQKNKNMYEITLLDLIQSNLLEVNEEIEMQYAPMIGNKKASKEDKKIYKAIIQDDGAIIVNNKKFNSPSYAALYCINDAGSPRKTVNGWTSWKTKNGKTLHQLRMEYLQMANQN